MFIFLYELFFFEFARAAANCARDEMTRVWVGVLRYECPQSKKKYLSSSGQKWSIDFGRFVFKYGMVIALEP